MATLAKRVSDLEAWKSAHISGHVLSGHTHPGDATDADVAALDRRIDELEAAPVIEPTPAPAPAPSTGTSVAVSAISGTSGLLAALTENANTEIVVADKRYAVAGATQRDANSLWIGASTVARTNPVLVRAQTTGGVTFDGGGARWWVGLGFMEGAHHQTWQGFHFANAEPTSTGVVTFGGYADKAGAHHITLRDITVEGSIVSQSGPGVYLDHALYFSESSDGVHDVLIDGWTVDGSGLLDSGIQFYSEAGKINARNVTIRHARITGTEMAIIFWASGLRDIVIEDSTVTRATRFAVRYEGSGTNVVLRRVTSSASGQRGFYSGAGNVLTLDGCAYNGEFALT